MVLSFSLATYVALWVLTFVYTVSMAWMGRRVGVIVEEVQVGIGPTVWTRRHNGEVWRFKPIPFSGHTRFRTLEEKEGEIESQTLPGTFEAAPLGARLLVNAVGPVSSLVLGILCLALAILLGHPQLVAETPTDPARPAEIVHGTEPSTWQGQFTFAEDTAGRYFTRLFSFRSMNGWGGYVAFFVSTGRTGAGSVIDWLTLVGLAGLAMGCLNLLPIPLMNGFHLLHYLAAAMIGRPRLPERVIIPLLYLGVLFMLVIFVRVMWLDGCWILDNIQAERGR